MESKHFNERLTKYLKDKNIKEQKAHQSSGLISPSKLANPTLEAALQLLGVPPDPPSNQQLRFFIRGQAIEEAIAPSLAFGRPTHQLQVTATYRNAIGLIDTDGEYPHEIKSAGFRTWQYVTRNGKPKLSHAIQSAFYALGTGKKYTWLHYVNTDTFQIHSFRIDPKDYQQELDNRIDSIIDVFVHHRLCDYTPLDTLHEKIEYCNYAEFFKKKGDEAQEILQKYYPKQYRLLMSNTLIERLRDARYNRKRVS